MAAFLLCAPYSVMAAPVGDCTGQAAGTECSMPGTGEAGKCTGEGNNCQKVPEMSDYLAAAFVVVAGAMIYRLRKKKVAQAPITLARVL